MAATYDVRFLLAGMMLLLIAAPMGVLLLWLRLTARSDMRLRLRPQRWEVTDSELEIDFFSFDEKNDEPVSRMKIALAEVECVDTIGGNYVVRTSHASAPALIAPREHLDAKSVKTLSDAAFANQRSRDDEELA